MLIRPVAALVGLAVVASLTLAGCGSDSGSEVAGVACDYPSAGSAAKDVDPPPDNATETGTVAVTIATGAGDLSAELDADTAPCTVNSFVSLAKQGYFDDTSCHRLTVTPSSIFVLQCGDPTASGSGGPGYTIADEVNGDETYPAGTLAMAKTAAPDSGGSQFFVVYADTPLPPEYTVFGHVDDASVAIVQKVAEAGTDNAFGQGDGHPTTAVDITKVTVG